MPLRDSTLQQFITMKNITSLIVLVTLALAGLTGHARNVMFNLTPGSAAELRKMNYTTYDEEVVATLSPGSVTLSLSDDYYYLYPAKNACSNTSATAP